MNKALGLIETVGYAPAMAAVDAAVKTAAVTFLGFDSVIGVAKKISLTVKLEGDVAAVKAAVEAGAAAAKVIGEVHALHVIPRPHDELDQIIFSKDTLASLIRQKKTSDMPAKAEELSSAAASETEKKVRKNIKPEQQS